MSSPFDYSLSDFFAGDFEDPLKAPPEFTKWRGEAREYHALFERTLATAADVRCSIALEGGRRDVINMASLDYLGICRHPEVVAAQQRALDTWGSGACGVPLLSGMTTEHRALQDEMSDLTGNTGTVLFTSGYAGATGLCSAVLRRGDVAILDAHAHMSWVDGVHMANAKVVTFDHNDPDALERRLEEHREARRLVVVDGLYSMDGDLADLPALLDRCDAHGVGMVVDEAHSMFALGDEGGGATAHFGVRDRVRLLFGTFSKALSVVGAFISGDAELIDYVRYYGHPYVFSAALPPATVAGIRKAVSIVRRSPELRASLWENQAYFRDGLQAMGLDTGESETWVVPVIVGGDRELLYRGVLELMERGLFVAPVDFPAVAEDRVRIRCAVSAGHTREDLDTALSLIEDVIARPMRSRGR